MLFPATLPRLPSKMTAANHSCPVVVGKQSYVDVRLDEKEKETARIFRSRNFSLNQRSSHLGAVCTAVMQ